MLPSSEDDFKEFMVSIKDRIRELAINDNQKGEQDQYIFYEDTTFDNRKRMCKKYMTKVTNSLNINSVVDTFSGLGQFSIIFVLRKCFNFCFTF